MSLLPNLQTKFESCTKTQIQTINEWIHIVNTKLLSNESNNVVNLLEMDNIYA